jgi:uncharacterized protein
MSKQINLEHKNNSQNICLSCGLCCDGSLIGFVQLEPEEIPVLREILELEEEDGKGFFLQPCSKFCDACTIYSQRPKSCDNFNCGLLKSVEQKELAFDAALEIIEEVKEKKLVIEKKLAILPFQLQSKSFYFKMVELKKKLVKKPTIATKNKAENTLSQTQLALITDLKQLDSLLLERFGVTLD